MLNTMQLMRYWIAEQETRKDSQSKFAPEPLYATAPQEQAAYDQTAASEIEQTEDDSEFVVSLT